MRLRGWVIGALNLFATDDAVLSEADAVAGRALADMATIAILQHRAAVEAQTVNDQLNRALTSRILIEQAKGILAERLVIDMPEAFATLRSYARRNNIRLIDVAQSVIDGTTSATELRNPD
jgi:AmiR/NasT family two-component response regulator